MAIIGGLKPSQLDIATINALNAALGNASFETTYGYALCNIRRKLRSMSELGKPLSSIRVALFADSIFASSTLKQDVVDYFVNTWGLTEANIDVQCCWGGYGYLNFIPCVDGAVIQPNVDLLIFSESPGVAVFNQMLSLIRQHSNCDILMGTWTARTDTEKRYNGTVDLAKIHDCELLDINAILLRKLQDGTINDYLIDGVLHLNNAGADLVYDDFVKHFESTRYYNEYANGTQREIIYFPGMEKDMAVNPAITLSGAWTNDDGDAVSSTSTDYIEITFTGIGFEAVFTANVAENIHNILIDSTAPSAYQKANGHYLEYCTQIIGKTQTNATWYFHRFFAAYVTAPFMTNDEEEVEFEITLGTPVRTDGVLTSLPYTLKQGATTLGTGNIFEDSAFTFRTTGEITIPATVYGLPNFIEWGGTYLFYAGDTMKFYARKTWKDSIDTNDETYLRVSGLDRGSHTLRITKATAVETKLRYISIYK